jgi:hypothetical protein
MIYPISVADIEADTNAISRLHQSQTCGRYSVLKRVLFHPVSVRFFSPSEARLGHDVPGRQGLMLEASRIDTVSAKLLGVA